ncbi:MAG: hypothetical protein AB7D37_11260 [Desulfovibrio sp.]
MLTPAELHKQALRKVSEGNRMAKQGRPGKAKGWWRYAARQAEKAGAAGLAADLWRRVGNEARARRCEEGIKEG